MNIRSDDSARLPHDHHRLSDMQAKVGWLLAHGRSIADAAEELAIGERTVREHVERLVARTMTRDREHLHTWLTLHLACCVEPVAARRPPPWDPPAT